MKRQPPKPARRGPEFAEEIVQDIMRTIRLQFCPDMPEKEWFKNHYHFLRRNAVMWPASFMLKKGFTIPGQRYREVMFGILAEIKQHGNLAAVQHWQFYLITCVQRHFKVQWEKYWDEAKHIQSRVETALLACKGASQAVRGVDPVELIAMAHRLSHAGTRKKAAKPDSQMKLL
jgi:hypothetical protein